MFSDKSRPVMHRCWFIEACLRRTKIDVGSGHDVVEYKFYHVVFISREAVWCKVLFLVHV